MASASALTIAIFASQVSMGLAQTCPLDQGDGGYACAKYSSGCGCADFGYTNLGGTIKCAGAAQGASANEDNCRTSCCKTTATCLSLIHSNTLNCGAGKRPSVAGLSNTAGTTAAEKITNCCETIPTVKCSAVSCTSSRRRSALYKKAVAAQADTVITSCDDSKCCETDIMTCGGQTTQTCGTGKAPMDFLFTDGEVLPLAATAFTNAADYITNCCAAKGKCSAHTCPTYMKKKTTPATECMSTGCSDSECCEFNADTCVTQAAKCTQTNVMFDAAAAMGKTFTVGDSDTKIQTACCVSKPTLTTPTCSDYFAAVTAAAKAAGSASGAYGQASSFAMLAVAGLVAVAM